MSSLAATGRRAFVLAGVAVVCGVVTNLIHPRRIAWVGDWKHHVETKALAAGLQIADTATARQIVEENTHVLLDARPAEDYRRGRLPGAISLPFDSVDAEFPILAPLFASGLPILVYCSGAACDESLLLAKYLKTHGITNVVLYTGGFEEWTRAGLPVEGRL